MQNIKAIILLLICLITCNPDLLSQKRTYRQIDKLMEQMPDSSTESTDGIAKIYLQIYITRSPGLTQFLPG